MVCGSASACSRPAAVRAIRWVDAHTLRWGATPQVTIADRGVFTRRGEIVPLQKEMAAQSYFGKPAKALTLEEGALLAGLTKGPNYYNPDRQPERRAVLPDALGEQPVAPVWSGVEKDLTSAFIDPDQSFP